MLSIWLSTTAKWSGVLPSWSMGFGSYLQSSNKNSIALVVPKDADEWSGVPPLLLKV